MKPLWNYNKDVNIELQKKLGNTFTHPYISGKIVDIYCDNKYDSVLEPSVGSGSFYYNIQDKIQYNLFDIYDIDEESLNLVQTDTKTVKTLGDFLTAKIDKKYSLIVANPPYISYKNIDAIDKIKYINEIKSTIDFDILGVSGDSIEQLSDIYMYFYLKCLSLLEEDGELVFLCSDTWMNSKFGEPFKKIITRNFKVKSITESHFYPFFEDSTNAIIMKIVKRTELNKNDSIKIEYINEPNFVISKTVEITDYRFIDILFNELNTSNQLLLYVDYLEFYDSIRDTVEAKTLLSIDGSGMNFNSIKNTKLCNNTSGALPLFYQPQARVGKPANYKQSFNNNDILFYINKTDVKQNHISANKAYMIKVINKFPLLFTFKGKCAKTTKYYSIGIDGDIEMIPMMLNNIISLVSSELSFKTANKRSSTKNKNGSIKETTKGGLEKIRIPDFKLLSEHQKLELLSIYNTYKNDQIFTIQQALENKGYLKLQYKLFEFFDFGVDIDIVISKVKEMYAIRDRDLEYLGLELVDL